MAVRVPRHLVERDPVVLAPEAGLRYVPDTSPGIARRRRGAGFTYLDPSGAPVDGDERERIERLAIPPAWESVWICADPIGYLQATGTDDAGRKQYRYHADFREMSESRKFARMPYFRRAVVQIRSAVDQALVERVGTRDHAVAAAVALIDRCLLRVGNDQSAANGHYGATTLTVEHIVDDGFVTLEYEAKSGQHRTVVVEDDDLSDILVDLADDADSELFWFDTEDGERRRATPGDINRFIADHGGVAFTAKDFRTWGGSAAAVTARAHGRPVLAAIDAAADELGNTRATARSSYIHPAVIEASSDAVEQAWRSSRSSTLRSRAESALGKLIDGV